MTTDRQQVLEAARPHQPSHLEELAACRVTARNARDKDDSAELLDALSASTDDGAFTALLAHLPDTVTTGDLVTTHAPSATTRPMTSEAGH
ncbi:hypothetical protein [Streptomyces sp. NPDC002758]